MVVSSHLARKQTNHVSRFVMAHQHNWATQCHSRWFTVESTK